MQNLPNGVAFQHRQPPQQEEVAVHNDRRPLIPLDDDQLAALGIHDPIFPREPRHRHLSVTTYIVAHFFLLALLFLLVMLVPFSFFCGQSDCQLDSLTIQVVTHVVTWMISAILHHVLHQLHLDSYVRGYGQMYRRTEFHRKLPFFVYSAGNVILLLMAVTLRESSDQSAAAADAIPRPFPWRPAVLHFVPLLVLLEAVALLPFLIRYLMCVLEFNRMRLPPDVAQDELLLLDGGQAEAAPSAVGSGRETCGQQLRYARSLLRLQADAIHAMNVQHSDLARLACRLNEQLQLLQQQQQQLRS